MEIRLERLTKRYGAAAAVEDLTLSLEDGKLLGLLGPSGCGKSTTLFMLAGLIEPTSGRIFFGGQDVTDLPPEKRGVGLVFQNYALYPHMTVQENITFPLINLKTPRKEAVKMAEAMAELVNIRELMKRKPGELSGGQQQRVAIARALVKKPKLLLLDEPLSNLDARLRIATREEIRRIQQEVGITTVFVTHDQEEAMSVSDRLALMDRGVLQQYGTPFETYRQPKNLFVAKFLGTTMNVFNAEIAQGSLRYGGAVLRGGLGLPDGPACVGIRPETFRPDPEGFEVTVLTAAVVGRDRSISFGLGGQRVRALLDSDNIVSPGETLRLSVRKGHIFLFDAVTQELAAQL